jgi:hypothetical protein
MLNVKKTNVSLKDKFESNPFMVELSGKMYIQPRANSIIAKGQNIIETETGEVINEQVLIGRRKYVDKSSFAKLYASEIGLIYDLSKGAQKVFMCLTKHMDYDNKAYFRWQEIYKTYASAYRGLKELVENNIIAPSDMINVYWLNPTIVCKGERFAKYTEYMVKQDDYFNEKDATKSRVAKQAKENIEKLGSAVANKMSKATDKGLFDDNNNNPYRQTSIEDKDQQNQK